MEEEGKERYEMLIECTETTFSQTICVGNKRTSNRRGSKKCLFVIQDLSISNPLSLSIFPISPFISLSLSLYLSRGREGKGGREIKEGETELMNRNRRSFIWMKLNMMLLVPSPRTI